MSSSPKPPDEVLAALHVHMAATSGRYGLHARDLRLKRFPSSAIEKVRSFTVHDLSHSVHVKFWPLERRDVWERWLEVRDLLELRHHAPKVIDVIEPELPIKLTKPSLGVVS